MPKFIAQVLIIFGSILIGLGIGIMINKAARLEESLSWIALTVSMIFGGLILGLGLNGRRGKKEVIIERVDEEEDADEEEE